MLARGASRHASARGAQACSRTGMSAKGRKMACTMLSICRGQGGVVGERRGWWACRAGGGRRASWRPVPLSRCRAAARGKLARQLAGAATEARQALSTGSTLKAAAGQQQQQQGSSSSRARLVQLVKLVVGLRHERHCGEGRAEGRRAGGLLRSLLRACRRAQRSGPRRRAPGNAAAAPVSAGTRATQRVATMRAHPLTCTRSSPAMTS